MNRERLRATLARDEGLNLSRHDVEGIDHIGYGFNLDIEWDDTLLEYLGVDDEHDITEITQEQADYILDWHIDDITKTITKRFPVFTNLSPLRQEIIMNMRFNLGAPRLRKFVQMWAAIEAENWHEARDQMMDSLWAKQVGIRATRLSGAMATDDEGYLQLDTKFDEPEVYLTPDGNKPLEAYDDVQLLNEVTRRFELLKSKLKEMEND